MKGAVIGCGRMGAFTSDGVRRFAPPSWLPLSHAEAIAEHPAVDLAALVDPVPEARERATKAFGAPGFADAHTMLEAVAPDLVGIATRTPGRAGLIEECLAAGVRALHVEKPLCSSVTELDRLEAALDDGRFLTLGAVRRNLSLFARARAMAWSGEYGALREVRVNLGAGALYWVHPHSVDLILWAVGDRRLEGVGARLVDPEITGGVVANDPVVAQASLWFDGGVVGHIGRSTGLDLILDCEHGAIIVENDGRSLSLHATVGDDPYPVRRKIDHPPVVRGEGALVAIDALVRCLSGEEAAIIENARTKRDILTGQRALFAMVQSHREGGRIVGLDDVDPATEIRAVTNGNAA